MHTPMCVYMCIPRDRLVFALYLWQERNYFIFFQVVPLNRGSLNTGNFSFFFFFYFLIFFSVLILFCMLEMWDYKKK